MKRIGLLISCPLALLLGVAIFFVQNSGALPEASRDETESNIARLSVNLLEQQHFSQRAFDAELADRFLTRYFDMVDPQRFHLTEDDLRDFDRYRTTLHELTRAGNTDPAHEIFARFIERLDERVKYVTDKLQNEPFEFAGEERYTPNRRKEPRPQDLDEARDLWRLHVHHEYLQEKLGSKKSDEEIVERLTGRYKRLLRNFKDLDRHEVFEIYMSALTRAFDPHSDYMGKRQFENFAISMKLSLHGIGALLQSEDGYCKIRELVPGGPADRSNQLRPNDRIVAVAQGEEEPVDVIDMNLSRVVELIRGPKDTEVRLTIIPANAPDPSVRRVVSLVRDEIPLESQEAKGQIIELPGREGQPMRVGVIDLPSFYADMESRDGERKRTTPDVAKLLQKFEEEGVEGVILDLRRNGGGSLEEAIDVTGLFIGRGAVVQIKNQFGRITVDSSTAPTVSYDGPLVVLTSRFSASASEILAGALQDYGRALVVGDSSTHGKGTVQSLERLGPLMDLSGLKYDYHPGAIKLTIRKFYRANGSSTQKKGVIPDITLPSVNNYAEVGEGSLQNPLAWDEVSAAKYRNYGLIEPVLDELRQRSERRIASNQDFGYIREDIEEFQRLLADRSVSLNEEQRLREKDEAKGRHEARLAERQARHDQDYTIYEITLRNVDTPGLPDPVGAADELQAEAGDEAGDLLSEAGTEHPELDEVEEELSRFDIGLEESKRILLDLIELSERHGLALSRRQ